MGEGFQIRKEEYSPLGDFVKISFVRDQAAIAVRFPKLDGDFLDAFAAKLEEVKVLESKFAMTEEQKSTTASLSAEAALLNKELNFLSSYFEDAGLDTEAVSSLKQELFDGNIEGAGLKIEGLKQYVEAHSTALEEEGMAADFPEVLEAYKASLAEKNKLQNSFINNRKRLTDANNKEYIALYGFISRIMKAGKLVFDDKVVEDEYTISRVLKRMRAAKRNGGSGNN
jgi:hypothetical protein